MKRNLGQVDKLVRLIFSLVFFLMGALYSPVWFAVSLILLVTAMTGTCGVYNLFGWDTRHSKEATQKKSLNVKKK